MNSSSNVPQDYGHPENRLDAHPVTKSLKKKSCENAPSDADVAGDSPESDKRPGSNEKGASSLGDEPLPG